MTESQPKTPKAMSWDRLLTDLGPSLVFFITYQVVNRSDPDNAIFIATAAFVPFAIAAFAYGWLKERRIAPIPAVTTVIVLGFAALALWLKDDIFIKMRSTILYVLFGTVLLVSVAARRNILKTVLEGAIDLPEEVWRQLALRAGLFYLVLAILNEAVWRTQPEPSWVLYNSFGDVALSLLFWVAQAPLLMKHMPKE
jgi:intracellular septation protein